MKNTTQTPCLEPFRPLVLFSPSKAVFFLLISLDRSLPSALARRSSRRPWIRTGTSRASGARSCCRRRLSNSARLGAVGAGGFGALGLWGFGALGLWGTLRIRTNLKNPGETQPNMFQDAEPWDGLCGYFEVSTLRKPSAIAPNMLRSTPFEAERLQRALGSVVGKPCSAKAGNLRMLQASASQCLDIWLEFIPALWPFVQANRRWIARCG